MNAIVCTRETLARSVVGSVELCSCDSVHLALGPFTLRLDPHAFEHLTEMLVAARIRLHARRLRTPVSRGATYPEDAA